METIHSHKFLSKTFYFVQNSKTGSVQLHPVLAGKNHEKYNVRLKISYPDLRHPLKSKRPVSELTSSYNTTVFILEIVQSGTGVPLLKKSGDMGLLGETFCKIRGRLGINFNPIFIVGFLHIKA